MLKKLSILLDHSDNAPTKGGRSQNNADNAHAFKEGFDFLQLMKLWPEIAGEKVAQYTIPLKNQHGVLIILSNHSAFAHQLSFMELPLKRKIFEKFPKLEKSIKSLKFIVDSTHFDQQVSLLQNQNKDLKKQQIPSLHPYSPEYRMLTKQAQQIFGSIEDEEIRNQFISLFIQNESKKFL